MTKRQHEKRKSFTRSVKFPEPDVYWRTISVIPLKAAEELASGGPTAPEIAALKGAGITDNSSSAVGTHPQIIGDPERVIELGPNPPQLKHSLPHTQMIAVRDIDVGVPHRAIDQQHLSVLAHSIQEIEQTTPISVYRKSDGRWAILEGWHRFEATISLGLSDIWAQVFDRAEIELRQLQISQNLHRKGLTALEQALSDAEWVETVRQKAAQVADPIGGRQPSEKGYSKAAREAGLTPERMARSSVISSISSDVQALIREHGLDDNQSALIKIARADKAVQHLKVLEIAQRQPRRSRKVEAGGALEAESSRPPAPGQNETEFMVEPDRSELTLDKVPDEQTIPELPAQSEPATTCQPTLSTPAFSDYPVLPDQLKRAEVEPAKKKLAEEWRSCRLRTILIAAPHEAGEDFINEVFLPDFHNMTGSKPVAGNQAER